jgi:hypothetical protein
LPPSSVERPTWPIRNNEIEEDIMRTAPIGRPAADGVGAEPDVPVTPVPKHARSVVGIVNSHAEAEEVIKELQRSGFPMKRLSVIGKGYHSEEHPTGFYTAGDRIRTWGGVGAFWGAVWGVLVGAAFFWVPGIGPLAAAGPFVQMFVGGLEGAVLAGGAGALGGALVSMGVPRGSIVKYESSLRADHYLIIAHGTPEQVEAARAILEGQTLEEPEVVAS